MDRPIFQTNNYVTCSFTPWKGRATGEVLGQPGRTIGALVSPALRSQNWGSSRECLYCSAIGSVHPAVRSQTLMECRAKIKSVTCLYRLIIVDEFQRICLIYCIMLLNLCVQVCGTYDIDREGSDALLQSCVCKAGPLYTGIALWRNFSGWICSVLFSHILFVTRTIISMPRVHRPIFCLLHAQCPWSHVASHSSQANHQDGFL